jgi:hypothetical protein
VRFFPRVRHAQIVQARLHGNLQAEKALFGEVKLLMLLNILTCKNFSRKMRRLPFATRPVRAGRNYL